ncbi:hypothetical protein C2857_007508 [Epichloe festucae Fl1]|uniref:Uncharacterized protein n=1 Tax=Epichloe festucae (strain Fl1) TaxID=877507 RepID=A0A7S9KMS7_EPIFF|nr:hypothetical protein C2857_007508 [Epichloe festucae Fl1]
MSIFSSLRKSRQQAKEHNAKLAEQKKKEDEHIPYKHVPTHAATDAFTSAPPSWREADRPRIVEQNRRRSAMAASGHHMNMPGVPRIGSSLSRVSFPGDDVTPVVRLPRAYSYTSVSPYNASARESREIVYQSPPEMACMQVSLKGKEVSRAYDSQRISSASSKGGPSPVDSSDGFASSQDDLEMKFIQPKTRSAEAEAVTTHRLHPSHARSKSDASVNQYTLSSTAKSPHTSHLRDSRPPPSMRGFGSIPAVAVVPPTNVGGISSYLAQGHVGSGSSNTSSPSNTLTPPSRQGSATSLSGLSYGPVKQQAVAPVTSHAPTAEKNEHGLNWLSLPEPDVDVHVPSVGIAAGPSFGTNRAMASPRAPQTTYSERPPTEVDRSPEPDLSQHNAWESQAAGPQQRMMDRSRAPPPVAHEHLVNVFPEMAMPDSQKKPGKGKKLSKGGAGKLKKNRWSSSKAPAVSV